MQKNGSGQGYQEVAHTADLAMQVWGMDLPSLFTQAGLGMLEMMGAKKGGKQVFSKHIELRENDLESLLVAFLSLILQEAEEKHIVYIDYDIHVDTNWLSGSLRGFHLHSLQREIKAITFHNLKITRDEKKYKTTLVFDI